MVLELFCPKKVLSEEADRPLEQLAVRLSPLLSHIPSLPLSALLV
jgi:hypothetical protein